MAGTLHGNCLDVDGFGVLILGAPGSGKSDLTYRLLHMNLNPAFRLVADDRVHVEPAGSGLTARVPAALAGLLEIRGLGIARMQHIGQTRPGLVVQLAKPDEIERLPDFPQDSVRIAGADLPVLYLNAQDASAAIKVHMAVQVLTGGVSLATDGRDGASR